MDNYVLTMGLVRAIYALLNIAAALLIWRLADVSSAMKINAMFGSLMGPLTFLIVSGLGMAGLARTLSPEKIILILLGVAFIIIGTTR